MSEDRGVHRILAGALALAGVLVVAPAVRAGDGTDGALPAPRIPLPIRLDDGGAAPADSSSLVDLARRDPAALGPLSIGTPDSGLLVNPRPMPTGTFWTIRDPHDSWGTDETIEFIAKAIEVVEGRYPGSPRPVIGDISRFDGGRLNRHLSHQAGRDADIGFYYRRGEVHDFLLARKRDLDLPRTWALVRAFVTETDVDRIFVDRSIISLLFAQAVNEGEDREWLDDIFGRKAGEKGIIQHERRHRDHMHVRFFNRRAQERGRIVYATLVDEGRVPPPTVKHRARSGETLGHLASRYGTTVAAIRRANGLRGSLIRAGRSYVIPVRKVQEEAGPVLIPPRRLPPGLRGRQTAGPLPFDVVEAALALGE